ncbi:hypothetical protein HG531_010244 [Fusarium graminearum]|nr:hypothetical protein HG531_010244 [Fusarium graminearum]
MAAINPMDFLLWLSEELETRDWDSATVGTQMGLAMNFLFLLARANSGSTTKSDDIFSDDTSSGWLSFVVHPFVWILAAFSFTNAFYTITRTRKYRLFLAKVDKPMSTPSARRVKVNQFGASPSTPLSYLANLITPESAESRAHPDKASDVWELSIWDPLPVSLRLACLFGPGHVLVYMIFLPLAPLDPRPSVTVLNTLLLQILVSAQLLFFCSQFAQQAKDKAVIQEQVMKEYDTKFVHPRLHPTVRDIGTQFSMDQPSDYKEFVQTGTPTIQIRHGFQTHFNPYTRAADTPDERSVTPSSNNVLKPHMFTPPTATRRSEAFRPATGQRSVMPRQSLPSGYTSTGTSSGVQGINFGGNMGIHTHNRSPLKKATSLKELNPEGAASPRNSREMAAYEQRNWGAGTPSKKAESRRLTSSKLSGGGNLFAGVNRQQAPPESRRPLWCTSMVTSFSHGKTEGNRVRLAILPTAQMGADPTYVYLGEWQRERQEPAKSFTLGDLGDWFKSKLPNHRPERGGTLRDTEDQDMRETSGIKSASPAHKDGSGPSANWPLSEQTPVINRRTGQQSGTGGSDRLVDWNTPKNLSELLPERSLSSKGKATTGQRPPTHQRWNNFSSPRLRNKLNQKAASDGAVSMKDKRGQVQSDVSGAQPFVPAMQMMPGILEVLEAKKKARKKARNDRESLIESGDYLGVQGINPQTGVLDLTSDSGDSALSIRTEQRLSELETQAKNATSAVKRKEAEAQIVKIHFDHDIAKLRRREETEKHHAKWRRDTHKWSSVQEPDLSPIAQSNRSVSALSRRKSCRDYSMPKHEGLIDPNLSEDQPSQEQRPDITISSNLRSRRSPNSTDTVVKTPHRGSLAALSPVVLDLFEDATSFHSADELGLDKDLLTEHDVMLTTINAQAADLTSEMTDAQEVKERANKARTSKNTWDNGLLPNITRSLDDKSFSSQPRHQLDIGEERIRDIKLPGEQSTKKLHARFDDKPQEIHYSVDSIEANRARIPRKPLPTSSRPGRPSPNPNRTRVELASEGKPRSAIKMGATEDGQFRVVSNSPASPKTSSVKSWEKGRPTTPERGRAVSDSRSSHRSTISNERRDSVAGASKSTQDSQRNRSQRRHSQTESHSAQYVIPNDTRDQRSRQSRDLRTEHESRHHEYVRGQGDMCIHKHHHHYWVRPDTIDIFPEKGMANPRESAPQAQSQSGSPQPATLRDNAKQFGYLPDKSWAEYIAETGVSGRDSSGQYCIGEPSESQAGMSVTQHRCSSLSTSTYTEDGKVVEMEETEQDILLEGSAQLGSGCLLSGMDHTGHSEQAMKLGAQISDSLQRHQDAEDDTADLSSNKHCQGQEGGLWDAIKEFLCTIIEYSTWLLGLYFDTVRPVFDTRSSYWSCTNREDRGWMNLVSVCLALPLIFGLSMVLVWGMELTVITLKCMDEDQDCMADEVLAMFRRSLTGVYPYE